MHLTLIRHGETPSNHNLIRMGQRIDDPLDKKGIDQALLIAEKLSAYSFDAIYSSPLLRAKETAEIVSTQHHLPIQYDDRLMERDIGSLSGSAANIHERAIIDTLPPAFREFDYDFRPIGGESIENVVNRFSSFVSEILKKHQNDHVLLVTHGGIIQVAYLLFDKDHTKILMQDVKNLSVHEFEII